MTHANENARIQCRQSICPGRFSTLKISAPFVYTEKVRSARIPAVKLLLISSGYIAFLSTSIIDIVENHTELRKLRSRTAKVSKHGSRIVSCFLNLQRCRCQRTRNTLQMMQSVFSVSSSFPRRMNLRSEFCS